MIVARCPPSTSTPQPVLGGLPRVFVALDVDVPRALELAEALRALPVGARVGLKVGSALFVEGGPDVVRRLRERGFEVFLDLKWHDIPHQMELAARAAAALDVALVTAHAAAGTDALRAVVRGVDGTRTRVVAVTVLTSTPRPEREGEWGASHGETVATRTRWAAEAGADGVVCAASDVARVRAAWGEATGRPALVVVPGIRPAGARWHDQRRVATPRQAIEQGADVLVVGRPITGAEDPVAAARAIVEEVSA